MPKRISSKASSTVAGRSRDCDKCFVLVEPQTGAERITKTVGPAVCPAGTVERHSNYSLQFELDNTIFVKQLIVNVHSSSDGWQEQFSMPLLTTSSWTVTAAYMTVEGYVVQGVDRKVVGVTIDNWSHNNAREFTVTYSYVQGRYEKLPWP